MKDILDRDSAEGPQASSHKLDGHGELEQGVELGSEPSIRERLGDVLNKPRKKLEIEDQREVASEKEVEKDREIDREVDRDRGFSHWPDMCVRWDRGGVF